MHLKYAEMLAIVVRENMKLTIKTSFSNIAIGLLHDLQISLKLHEH